VSKRLRGLGERYPLWRWQRRSGSCGLMWRGVLALEKVAAGGCCARGGAPALEKAVASDNRAGEDEQQASDGECRDGCASWEKSLSYFFSFFEKP